MYVIYQNFFQQHCFHFIVGNQLIVTPNRRQKGSTNKRTTVLKIQKEGKNIQIFYSIPFLLYLLHISITQILIFANKITV